MPPHVSPIFLADRNPFCIVPDTKGRTFVRNVHFHVSYQNLGRKVHAPCCTVRTSRVNRHDRWTGNKAIRVCWTNVMFSLHFCIGVSCKSESLFRFRFWSIFFFSAEEGTFQNADHARHSGKDSSFWPKTAWRTTHHITSQFTSSLVAIPQDGILIRKLVFTRYL